MVGLGQNLSFSIHPGSFQYRGYTISPRPAMPLLWASAGVVLGFPARRLLGAMALITDQGT